MTPELTTVTAVIAAVCGVTALVLSFINTWHQLRRDQVRLKVVPEWAITPAVDGAAPFNFEVDVINLSEFPVFISEVGFSCRENTRLVPINVRSNMFSTALPCRLEPHAVCTQFYLLEKGAAEENTKFGKVNGAFALTQCGVRATGTSPAIREVVRRISGNEE